MSTRSLHHGFLQQIHRRSTRNSTTSGLRWLPIFPEKGSRHPHLFHLEMSEVPDEEVPIYRTPQHSRPAPLNLMKCFFHLCQSFQKRISKSFRKLYRTDKAFARTSRLVAFLAFVPLDSIEDAFEARPTVQEYFRAIWEEQVTTDFHLDRFAVGLTPSKKRKTCNEDLYQICSRFEEYPSVLEYMFAVALAEFFGHSVTI